MPDADHLHHADVTVDPEAEARLECSEERLREREASKGNLLPGVAGICMFLLLFSMINAYAAVAGKFVASPTAKYSMLAACTLIVVGVFGLLRVRRWGWSLIIAACLVLSGAYFYGFERTHFAPYMVQGLFSLVFFLYLSRSEVRQRLR